MNPNTNPADTGTTIKVSPATAGSVILLVSFFLPWVNIMGGSVAGYQLRQIWAPGPYLWSIPALAAIAIAMGMAGRNNIAIAQSAGGLPLVFLAVALYQFGGDLFKGVAIGGWLTLISGVFLLSVAPRFRKKATEVPALNKRSSPPRHETEINR